MQASIIAMYSTKIWHETDITFQASGLKALKNFTMFVVSKW